MKNFLRIIGLYNQSLRFCSSSAPAEMKYYGFTYYPRYKDFKDPPYTPSKLFLIRRIKPIKGTHKDEKECLAQLDIDGHRSTNSHMNVVKNTPEVNALLWKVKHLVEIRPITWKGELPKDCKGTHLRFTGELVIAPKLAQPEEVLTVSAEYENDTTRLKPAYIKQYLKKRWEKYHW